MVNKTLSSTLIISLIILSLFFFAGCEMFPQRKCSEDVDCINLSCGCLTKGSSCDAYEKGATPKPGVCVCDGAMCKHVPQTKCETNIECIMCHDGEDTFCANTDWMRLSKDATKTCAKKSQNCICEMNKCVPKPPAPR